MLDRLTTMEVFVKAAELGSFTAAGVALGLSPQMVDLFLGPPPVAAGQGRASAPVARRSLS